MRCTKIIATVGPASRSPDVLRQLLTAGVDVFRLNFSHGTHESHAETYRAIRKVAADCGRHIAVMQDLSGPKIRTGPLAGSEPLQLTDGRRAANCGRRSSLRAGPHLHTVSATDRIGARG